MVIKICEDKCIDCKKNFLKDSECLGDYTNDGVLLRYCPKCGKMYPYLSITYIEKKGISNRARRNAGVKIAQQHNLDYRAMAVIIKNTQLTNKNDFANNLSKKINITFNILIKKEEVLKNI